VAFIEGRIQHDREAGQRLLGVDRISSEVMLGSVVVLEMNKLILIIRGCADAEYTEDPIEIAIIGQPDDRRHQNLIDDDHGEQSQRDPLAASTASEVFEHLGG
jgi:hypothetical protein